MGYTIELFNLWIFYLLAYAIAFPLRTWANARRGEPIEDPEFLEATPRYIGFSKRPAEL